MMSLVIGLSNLAIGLAYAGLGALSAWEAISLHRYRGWSRFGIGFSLMAASCGPHHLVHGWHVLQGESISWPMFAVTLIGLPAGLIFVLLRLETMWGGQGERLLAASPRGAVVLAGAFTVAAGWLAASAFAQPGADVPFLQVMCTSAGLSARATAPEAGIDFASVAFLANVFVTVTYGMVGWYLADHQVRRHLTSGAWSLSGVALTGVFFTCAQMHLIDATTQGSGLMLLFDLMGIPASIYFLRVVKQVHNDSVFDWNRRPLVGAAAAPARPSPWSGASTRH
jgi:hypothetical protein